MTPKEREEKRTKEILYLRHRLQKGFISRDGLKEEEMASMSEYLKHLESRKSLEAEILKATKIHKVLKAILKLNSIPKEEEFNFKQRMADLLAQWNSAILSVEPPSQAPVENHQREPESSLLGERMDVDVQHRDEPTASDHAIHQEQQSILVVFDSAGDQELIIRDKAWEADKRVLVSSSRLRKISPFWESLLQHATIKPVLNGEGYSWELILLLLHIAHGNTHHVPERLPLDKIWDAAFLSVEYDAVELMRPFLRNWAWPRMPVAVSDAGKYLKWLLFAWVLGYQDTFEAVTRSMAMTFRPDAEDMIAGEFNTKVKLQKACRIILDNVSRIRSGIIQEIITVCHWYVERLSGNCCTADPPSRSCESLALGSIIKGLSSVDPPLWPQRPDPQHLTLSVHDLIRKLGDVVILTGHEEDCDYNMYFHEALALCLGSNNRIGVVTRLVASVSGFVTLEDEHKAHFNSFSLKASDLDPLIWKSNAVATMGFVERDAIGLVYEMRYGEMRLCFADDETWGYDSEEEKGWDEEDGEEGDDEMDTDGKDDADGNGGNKDDADGNGGEEEDPHWDSDYYSVTEPEEEFLATDEESDYAPNSPVWK